MSEFVWYDQREMFMKKPFHDPLVCVETFVGRTPLAVSFLLPLSNWSLRVCFPTFYAAVLKFFLPLTTSAVSDAGCSNSSKFTHFAAGTLKLRKKRHYGSPSNFCKCIKSLFTWSIKTSIDRNLHLSWSNHLVTSFSLENIVGGFFEHQGE